MYQMKEQDKTPEKLLNEVEIGNLPETEMNNTITEMKTILEGINSRITEAEEWISDLEDRMVEFTADRKSVV